MATRCSLHDNPDDSDERSADQRNSSTPSLGDGRGNESPEEAPCLEGGDDIGRQIGLADSVEVLQTVLASKEETISARLRIVKRTYTLNGGIVRTPPMIPESIPNNIPPKQA